MHNQDYQQFEDTLLNKHENEFKSWTRLLLTLSIGGFTFLFSFQQAFINSVLDYQLLALLSLFGLFLSSSSGLVVQHQSMMKPLQMVNEGKKRAKEVAENQGEGLPVTISAEPSKILLIFYRVQIWAFLLSFSLLLIYTFLNVQNIFKGFANHE